MTALVTVIAGSREFFQYDTVRAAIESCGWPIARVLSGGAAGVDTLGERWATANGIPFDRFPADWDRYGLRAGFMRNVEMAQRAQALVAVWDGNSRGTRHMIETAHRHGLRIHVRYV